MAQYHGNWSAQALREFIAAESQPLVLDYSKYKGVVHSSPIKTQVLLFAHPV